MRPIEELTNAEATELDGLLFDLDDTLLNHGWLTEPAYSALFRLREGGLTLFAVTGRPAGWGEVLARQWPVDGFVTENGAVALHRKGPQVLRIDAVSPDVRVARQRRLAAVASDLRRQFPVLEPTDDMPARTSDYAFDIGERRQVSPMTVAKVIAMARERGIRTTHSSVHLHLSLDGDDKASGVVRALRQLQGVDPGVARSRFAYIGDSANDASCFAAFRTTIGVANVSGSPTVPPRYVTRSAMGAGFAEAARVLLERRGVAESHPMI